MYLSKCNQ